MKYTEKVLRNRMLMRMNSEQPLEWRDEYLNKPLTDEELTAYIEGLLFVWQPEEKEKANYYIHNYGSLPFIQTEILRKLLNIDFSLFDQVERLVNHINELRTKLSQADGALRHLQKYCQNFMQLTENYQEIDIANKRLQIQSMFNSIQTISQD